MKIEHVALYCRDLEKTREFFQEFFGAKAGALYRNSKGFSSYFLTFDDGARLEIMNFPISRLTPGTAGAAASSTSPSAPEAGRTLTA